MNNPADTLAACPRCASPSDESCWHTCATHPTPSPGPQGGGEDRRNLVRAALTTVLGDAMDCTRVWDAWRVGTMTESDFCLIVEDSDRLEDIVDAVLLATPPAQQPGEVASSQPEAATEAMIRAGGKALYGIGKNTTPYERTLPDIRATMEHMAAVVLTAALARKEK